MCELDKKIGEDIAVIKHKVTDIEIHLRQLNGDTKENRTEITNLKTWRWFITGGLAVSSLMIPVILFLIQFWGR